MSRTVDERLIESGHEDVLVFRNPSYDDALIGVDSSNRAVYDFDLMVKWLMERDGIGEEEAEEFIEYNSIGSLPSQGSASPIVMYCLEE